MFQKTANQFFKIAADCPKATQLSEAHFITNYEYNTDALCIFNQRRKRILLKESRISSVHEGFKKKLSSKGAVNISSSAVAVFRYVVTMYYRGKKFVTFIFVTFLYVRKTIILELFGSQDGALKF